MNAALQLAACSCLQPGGNALEVVLLCEVHKAHTLQVWQCDACGVHKGGAQHLFTMTQSHRRKLSQNHSMVGLSETKALQKSAWN